MVIHFSSLHLNILFDRLNNGHPICHPKWNKSEQIRISIKGLLDITSGKASYIICFFLTLFNFFQFEKGIYFKQSEDKSGHEEILVYLKSLLSFGYVLDYLYYLA